LENKILNNLPEVKALRILEEYDGVNNYIVRLKNKMEKFNHFKLTRAQSDYIIKFKNVTPKIARKWVDLDSYFGQKLMDDKLLPKKPEKIYVEKLLVEKEKSYHIWGKLFESEKLTDMWLPKVALTKNKQREVKIDYEKYSHRPPLSHQKESIEKLVGNDKFILADDMGLGKTTSTIIASLEMGTEKVLIICPASLKINWQREIENYTDKEISIVEGKKWEPSEYTIINYDILKNFHDPKHPDKSDILNYGFDLVVMDEAHYVQNQKAQRTKIANDIANKVGKVWLLTGTPMTSRPMNYYNLLNLVDSPVADNWMAYAIRYCAGYQFSVGSKRVWNVTGASNLEELRDRTKPQVLRRLKEDILDLPEKILTPVYLRTKSKEYKKLMGEYYDWYKSSEESTSLTIQFSKLMKVRQVIAEEKIKDTIEIAENIIEQGKKVIIFTNFTDTLNKITNHFGNVAVKLDGKMSKPNRQHSVDEFQNNDKVKVFVGNLKAAGVGITLTAAEAVIMNDLSFVPSDHSQAEDRAYRYGQKFSVSVYYPIFENTVESVIYNILSKKKNIFETVMGDNEGKGDVMEEILNMISQET
jgi:SWI/SNF-related matrix-associated actin-dependent regulator 1 of chromatin subfamily A|tara:strand:- start:7083 stop:8837 length:1755 start_codon:yes stop_codon:yes gene_type:complete